MVLIFRANFRLAVLVAVVLIKKLVHAVKKKVKEKKKERLMDAKKPCTMLFLHYSMNKKKAVTLSSLVNYHLRGGDKLDSPV